MPEYADRMKGLSGNAIREIFHLLSRPEVISFAGGMPGKTTFQSKLLSDIAGKLLAENGAEILQYGSTEGYAPLLGEMDGFYGRLGMSPRGTEKLIVSGAQQGIDLICKAFINPGDTILVENPTFLGALHTMRTYQANLVPMPTDSEGLITQNIEKLIARHKPKLIYVIPTFQNPTGLSLAKSRRKELADIAQRNDVLVIEDDPYRDLRYSGQELPAVKTYDASGNIIYLSSFSKLISPGLRVGAVYAREDIIKKLTIGKQAADVHTSILSQAIVAKYLQGGYLPGHLAQTCEIYKQQLTAMLEMFDIFPSGVSHTNPEGGLFVWVRLPENIDAGKLLPVAAAAPYNIAFVPGVDFHCDKTHSNTLRLNFSNADINQIQRGMEALAQLLRNNI